jgi:hypothetical protein
MILKLCSYNRLIIKLRIKNYEEFSEKEKRGQNVVIFKSFK